MTDRVLFFLIVGIFGLTCYLMMTAPEISPEDRRDMEEEWWD